VEAQAEQLAAERAALEELRAAAQAEGAQLQRRSQELQARAGSQSPLI